MSDNFPSPEAADPQDVTLALETGEALWANGKTFEALRWLRRAADSAEQAGNDLRAVFLAKTAAELTTLAEQQAPPVADKVEAEPVVAAATPSRGPPPLPPPAAMSVQTAPAPDAHLADAAVVAKAAAPEAVTSAELLPEPAAAPAPVRPRPAAPERPHSAPLESRAPAPVAAAAPDKPPAVVAEQAPRSTKKVSPIKVRGETVEVDVRQALRVAVKRSVRDDNLYVVRKLDDGQAPALGSAEALLILLERE